MRVLLLGGTTEASQMAKALNSANIETVFSYAGRTNTPVAQPVPTRVGGFGGAEGLIQYLRENAISHIIDATHPFAAQMSTNASVASKALSIPTVRLERPAWQPAKGDDWQDVPDIESACDALPDAPSNVFLAIGRMHIDVFAGAPQHHYLLRLVDTPTVPPTLPHHTTIVARGPFDTEADMALMREHNITHLIAKNAGGTGAVAKIAAARSLSLRMIMIARPKLPDGHIAPTPIEVLRWLGHDAERGV